MAVRWLASGVQSLLAQLAYIEKTDPLAAQRMGDVVARVADHLADFSLIGRVGRVADTRELVVPGTPFIAVYRVTASGVDILRVLHGAQRWPPIDSDPD